MDSSRSRSNFFYDFAVPSFIFEIMQTSSFLKSSSSCLFHFVTYSSIVRWGTLLELATSSLTSAVRLYVIAYIFMSIAVLSPICCHWLSHWSMVLWYAYFLLICVFSSRTVHVTYLYAYFFFFRKVSFFRVAMLFFRNIRFFVAKIFTEIL